MSYGKKGQINTFDSCFNCFDFARLLYGACCICVYMCVCVFVYVFSGLVLSLLLLLVGSRLILLH